MAVETVNQNQEVEVLEKEEVVEVVESNDMEAVQEETPVFENHIVLSGNMSKFSWEEEAKEIYQIFSGFNTTINDVLYRTEIGVDEEGVTTITIAYNGELTLDILNYIITHIMQVSVDTCEGNDQAFFNQTQEGTMDAKCYVMTKPVIEAIGILHTWGNISHFQADEKESEEVNVENIGEESEAVNVVPAEEVAVEVEQ